MAFQTQLLCQPFDRLYETMTLAVSVVGCCLCVLSVVCWVLSSVCELWGGHFWFTLCLPFALVQKNSTSSGFPKPHPKHLKTEPTTDQNVAKFGTIIM